MLGRIGVVSCLGAALAHGFTLGSVLDNEKLSPAQRVVKLLKEMKTQLEEEASKDAEIAKQLECWCKTNTEEKTKAIKDGDAKTDELTATIEESAGKKAKLDVTIKQAKKEIVILRNSLEKATKIREKERQSFRDTETEMVKTVTNLENAIAVLKKHQSGLMQMSNEMKTSIQTVIHAATEKHLELFGKKPNTNTASFLQADSAQQAIFLQATSSTYKPVLSEHSAGRLIASFVDSTVAPHLGAYQSQSNGIFGILTSMLDNFKANMSDSVKNEKIAQDAFLKLKKASEEQISATSDALSQAKLDFADASKLLSDSKEELEKTRDVRAADVEFLRNLKLQCNDIDAQWAARQKERADETTAVSEAIAVLTEDENRELLAKKVTMFLEIKSKYENLRSKAAAVLRNASRKSPSWDDLSFQWKGEHPVSMVKHVQPKQELAVLAAQTQLDAFTKVKKAMDDMMAQIKSQMSEDVKHRDFCVSEFSTNSKNSKKKTHEHEDLVAKIEDLSVQISQLESDIKNAKEQISVTQTEIKKASEDREKENGLFQTEVSEQRATQVVLQKALDKLNSYYAKKKESFLQLKNNQTPPVAFEAYNKNSGASPVLSLIEKIVEDSKKIELEAVKDEQSSQTSYETFVADSNNSIKQLESEIASNSESKANKESEKVDTETEKNDAETSLEMLANYKADLHQSCDFTMKNFEVRQQAMTDEIEAIQEAKAILSGAK